LISLSYSLFITISISTSVRLRHLVAVMNTEDRFAVDLADTWAQSTVALLAAGRDAGLDLGRFAFGKFVEVGHDWILLDRPLPRDVERRIASPGQSRTRPFPFPCSSKPGGTLPVFN
jgi:hypothetical protein